MPYMVTGAHAPRDDANRRCRPFAPVPNPVMGPRTARLRSKLMRGVSVRRHYFCPFWRRFFQLVADSPFFAMAAHARRPPGPAAAAQPPFFAPAAHHKTGFNTRARRAGRHPVGGVLWRRRNGVREFTNCQRKQNGAPKIALSKPGVDFRGNSMENPPAWWICGGFSTRKSTGVVDFPLGNPLENPPCAALGKSTPGLLRTITII